MKKLCLTLCTFAILLNLMGCVPRSLTSDEIKARAKTFTETVVATLEQYDEASFDALFTDEARNSEHFTKGKEYLLETFHGKVFAIDDFSIHEGGSFSSEGRAYKATVMCTVATDKNEYRFYLQYYLEGHGYTDKIFRLRVAIASELPENGPFSRNGGLGPNLGIYHPEIVLDEIPGT